MAPRPAQSGLQCRERPRAGDALDERIALAAGSAWAKDAYESTCSPSSG